MRELFLKFFLVLTSLLISFLILEIFLRMVGHKTFNLKNEISTLSLFKNDDVLGWTTEPGDFSIKLNNKNINYKILNDGSRFTGNQKNSSKSQIIFIGGSFTFGDAIDDEETIPYKIQENSNKYNVKNFGVSGFGTYQSYLNLKKIYRNNNNIKYVIYLFIDHHEVRNAGDASWLEDLNSRSKEPVSIPYVSINKENKFIEHSPITYVTFNLSKYSVLITKLQKKIMRLKFYSKNNNQELITQKILVMINEMSKENNNEFIFINLLSKKDKIEKYKIFSESNNIRYGNCVIDLNEKYIVKNNGHPNNLANKEYSKCISKFIQ